MSPPRIWIALAALVCSCCHMPRAGDWPLWGGGATRNMVSAEQDLPSGFTLRPVTSAPFGRSRPRGFKWSARLGSQSFGNPVVSGGMILVGTNNDKPRNPAYREDRGILMCFRERDGRFLWQLPVPKIKRSDLFNGDRSHVGLCSSPVVEGGRIYVVTNRAEVLCLDAKGFRDGNNGPFRTEGKYYAQPLWHVVEYGNKRPCVSFAAGHPVIPSPNDADIIWRFDMIEEVHSWPQDAANGCPLSYGGRIYVTTSNGISSYRKKRRALYPDAPSLIALDKHTGRLVAVDREGIAGRTWHGQWSSPALGVVNGVPLLFYGGGDGWCYAFDARPEGGGRGRAGTLKTVWRYDCNPPELRFRGTKAIRYDTAGDGPSEIIATPVFYRNRVYVAVGQDPSHGRGRGCLSCIDATRLGDVTETARIWSYRGIDRSLSTVAIHDGRLYAADYSGRLHCLDADTGEVLWIHHTQDPVWGSPLVADGKIYLGTARGYLHILAEGPNKHLLARIRLGRVIRSTPVAANGVLYIMSGTRLFAVAGTGRGRQPANRLTAPMTAASD